MVLGDHLVEDLMTYVARRCFVKSLRHRFDLRCLRIQQLLLQDVFKEELVFDFEHQIPYLAKYFPRLCSSLRTLGYCSPQLFSGNSHRFRPLFGTFEVALDSFCEALHRSFSPAIPIVSGRCLQWEAKRPVVTASDTDEDLATVDVAPAVGVQQVEEFVAPISAADDMLSADEQINLSQGARQEVRTLDDVQSIRFNEFRKTVLAQNASIFQGLADVRHEVEAVNAKVDIMASRLNAIQKDAEATKEALSHQLLEFQSSAQENHNVIHAQLSSAVTPSFAQRVEMAKRRIVHTVLDADRDTAERDIERRRKEASTCVTLNGSGIQLAVGPQPLRLRNHNFGHVQRIMVKRLATSPHDPLGITDSACKNQLVVVSVQYGPSIHISRSDQRPLIAYDIHECKRAVNPRQRSIDSYMHRGLTQPRRLMTPNTILKLGRPYPHFDDPID
ncbi:flotillin-like protein 3 [Dorcoceras hygrometricum]|uniref:Flotillin-like protein 3 n=1 Tax=Dorcoceras hygrometricum TaxID=472368 RepID=A0A2Z7D363_9LAMI|nr:flotillin-like protein 3 [Dorcoceras hygrometricum]